MAHLVYFAEERVRLAKEISENHPKLVELLQKHPQAEFEIILAEVAAYCEVVLDGTYLQTDIDKLCDILYKKLVAKRVPIILLS